MTTESVCNFWKTVKLYVKKPHVINRRLAGCVEIGIFKYFNKVDEQKLNQIVDEFKNIAVLSISEIVAAFKNVELKTEQATDDLFHSIEHAQENGQCGLFVINKLLAKNLKLFSCCYELTILGEC